MDNKQIARKNDAAMVVASAYTVEKPETKNKKSQLREALEGVGGLAIWVALGLIFGKPVWITFSVLLVGGCLWEFVKAVWERCTEGRPVGLVKVNRNGK
jgi:hypothetical protein